VAGANFKPAAEIGIAEMCEALTADAPALGMLRATYQAASPDGPEHWTIVVGKLVEMYRAEPDIPIEDLGHISAPTLVLVGALEGARMALAPTSESGDGEAANGAENPEGTPRPFDACPDLEALEAEPKEQASKIPPEGSSEVIRKWELVIPRFRGPNHNTGPVLTGWALDPNQ
jgi:hypothetical protein